MLYWHPAQWQAHSISDMGPETKAFSAGSKNRSSHVLVVVAELIIEVISLAQGEWRAAGLR